MAISAKDVKRLRDQTGVGMMDCKKALQEADGDFEKAVELLRMKGQKVAAKRADREAKEGLIVTVSTDDHATAVLAEVNCETDFVARNDDFQSFAKNLAVLILREQPADRAALMTLDFDGQTVERAVTEMTGRIGEKIDVRRFAVVSNDGGKVVSYIHPGARLGVLVKANGNGNVADVARDVAMQVAALDPVATTVDEVPAKIKEKEMEIAREAARNEGKPEHILDRIAEGKLKRYYKDYVLVEQPFVKDAQMTVGQMLKQAGVAVSGFTRFSLGN